MSDLSGIMDKLLGRDGKTSFDALVTRMRNQQKRIIQAEGDEAKAQNALDAAHDALEQEKAAYQAMVREFYAAAREEGIKPELST